MLSYAILPILAAGAFAAPPPAYPTAYTTAANPTAPSGTGTAAGPTGTGTAAGPSYPKATDSSDFLRLALFLKGDSVPDGSPLYVLTSDK